MITLLSLAMLFAPLDSPEADLQENRPHARGYWKSIVDNDFALPEGESAYDLIVELAGYLGSTDSELRDDFAYGIPTAWIYRQNLLRALHVHLSRFEDLTPQLQRLRKLVLTTLWEM